MVLRRCLSLASRYRCTSVVGVFPNHEFLLAGYLTAKLTGAKLYPYFHNTLLEQSGSGWERRFAEALQSRVFAAASHVFVMSEGMVELYRERYPHVACTALVHSFNEDLPAFTPPPPPSDPVRVTLSGNINGSCTDAAVRACAAVSRMGCTLTIFSGTPRRHLAELGLLTAGVKHETVSRDVLLSRLAEADVLLLAHGFTGDLSEEEYRTIFPTRTIEYLICGRPIIAHAPPHAYLTRFLRAHHCAFIVDTPDERAVAAAIRRLTQEEELRHVLVRNALRTAKLFHAPAVASRLRSVLAGGAARRLS